MKVVTHLSDWPNLSV